MTSCKAVRNRSTSNRRDSTAVATPDPVLQASIVLRSAATAGFAEKYNMIPFSEWQIGQFFSNHSLRGLGSDRLGLHPSVRKNSGPPRTPIGGFHSSAFACRPDQTDFQRRFCDVLLVISSKPSAGFVSGGLIDQWFGDVASHPRIQTNLDIIRHGEDS